MPNEVSRIRGQRRVAPLLLRILVGLVLFSCLATTAVSLYVIKVQRTPIILYSGTQHLLIAEGYALTGTDMNIYKVPPGSPAPILLGFNNIPCIIGISNKDHLALGSLHFYTYYCPKL